MKPTGEQLKAIFLIFNDCHRKSYQESCEKVWDFVESELNKIHPLPEAEMIYGNKLMYICRSCKKKDFSENWHLSMSENVEKRVCPECGAIHSEAISSSPDSYPCQNSESG